MKPTPEQTPPGVFVQQDKKHDQRHDQATTQPDWKDMLALVLAAYQIVLPHLLLVIGAMCLGLLLMRWFFH